MEDSLGINHPIQTNAPADYKNKKSLIKISKKEDDEQNDQI